METYKRLILNTIEADINTELFSREEFVKFCLWNKLGHRRFKVNRKTLT